MLKTDFRPIKEIMSSCQELDILFIQPSLLQYMYKEEQSKIVRDYWEILGEHAALLGDLPFEPNHGLYTLAAQCRNIGLRVDVLDFHMFDLFLRQQPVRKMLDEQDIFETLRKKTAKIYGVSTKTVSSSKAMKIAKIIKELYPDSFVIVGGSHATFAAREMLQECAEIDIVVRGEGEFAILELWNCIVNDGNFEKVSGITYKMGNQILENPRQKARIILDELPYPAYDLLCKEASNPLVPRILSARGCVLKCDFCSVTAFFQQKINFRDPIKVVDEIQFMIENFGVDFICLGDLTFMASLSRGKQICEEIIRRKINIKWWCQSTIGRIDQETAVLMKKAGCVQIGFGIESGMQEQLDKSSKMVTLKQAENQCELVRESGISVQTYWIIGLPYETHESALFTIDLLERFVLKKLTDVTHISVCVPYPGTPLYANAGNNGIVITDNNFDNYWMNCDELGYGKPVLETPSLSADHIYMYWQLALATATHAFNKRFGSSPGRVHYYPGSPDIKE